MAYRQQNSAKGVIVKNVIAPATLDLSSNLAMSANSTGIVVADYETSLPGNVDNGLLFGFIKNSTGFSMFINTTGTVHRWVMTTATQTV